MGSTDVIDKPKFQASRCGEKYGPPPVRSGVHSRCSRGSPPSANAQDAAMVGSRGGEAVPGAVFSDTGPDAAAYGAAAGFPVGTRATAGQLENLVGTYSHYDEMFSSRRVRRATTPWLFKRAPEPAISYNFKSDRLSIEDYLGRNPTTALDRKGRRDSVRALSIRAHRS
jgi:hypothetical protein